MYKHASMWFLSAFVVLVLLQTVPIPGIFIAALGGAFLAGVLLHLFLISLAAEAIVGSFPRFLLIIPVAAYGGYYFLYFQQMFEINRVEAELRKTNPHRVLLFDADKHDLIINNADEFIQTYKIPVVYSEAVNKTSEKYISHRMIALKLEKFVRKGSASRFSSTNVLGPRDKDTLIRHRPNHPLTLIKLPQKPRNSIISVKQRQQHIYKRKATIEYGDYSLEMNREIIGVYRTASIYRYSPIPIVFIGCGLVSAGPSWSCDANLSRSLYHLQTTPDGIDASERRNPVAIMLGIERYTKEELDNYRGYDEHSAVLELVRSEVERVERKTVETLERAMDDDSVPAPSRFSDSLASMPERLAPLSARLASYFVRLMGPESDSIADINEKRAAAAAALAALPANAYTPHAEAVFEALKMRLSTLDEVEIDNPDAVFPALYIRAADAGEEALSFYKSDLIERRYWGFLSHITPLALCRLGIADKETVDFLRNAFLTDGFTKRRDYYGSHHHQAVFLTLLRLGQRSFVEENLPDNKALIDPSWYKAVLKAEGNAGKLPNNCMIPNWPVDSYLPKELAPVLSSFGIRADPKD